MGVNFVNRSEPSSSIAKYGTNVKQLYLCATNQFRYMSLYAQRGVSAQKEEVHAAIQHLDQGLYPNAFCKLYADLLGGDQNYINIMHADGAGTKSILAYIFWKETGDVSVWKGIAQDAIAMNLDDLLCVGIYDQILFSSTIDRNKLLINGEVISEVINGTQSFFETLKEFGVQISFLGGETADVGDVVRTIAVNGTMTARWPKSKLITNDLIAPGQVIVGFSSYGQAKYETAYNSGLGSNGLTSARHDVLSKEYATKYPSAKFVAGKRPWEVKVDIALPCATQNELNEAEAKALIANGVKCVAEGANMPSTPEAITAFQAAKVQFAPGKASNAGGVATSGLEMSQNSLRLSWTAEEVDSKLHGIMVSIHTACVQYGKEADGTIDYVKGANIAGFVKVADSMIDQGLV